MVGFGFAAGLMDGFRFYGFGRGFVVAWVCGYGFVVDRWWLCAVCGGFVGMVVVGGGSVQCVVGLRVWWLSVVALCSVWWFAVWVFGFAAGLMDGFRFYGFVVMGLSAWVYGYGFAGMGLWWIGGGSVQCVVGLWVWWLSVVALCSVWWFTGMVVVGGGSVQCVVVCGVGLRVWWLWVCGGPTTMSWQLPLSAMIINNIPIFFNARMRIGFLNFNGTRL
uniref:Uncharacterized protein n=1 Tax=Fagus sylvatica TaxID=28930 RepID=A0A2N9J649_FAGSY